MGTKANPGSYDCYAKLAPDEPYLTLRGKDPAAPYLVMAWVKSRQGDWPGCLEVMMAMVSDREVQARASDPATNPKLEEALRCAFAMRDWRTGRDKTKVQPAADAGPA